jgi:hypothetical protein
VQEQLQSRKGYLVWLSVLLFCLVGAVLLFLRYNRPLPPEPEPEPIPELEKYGALDVRHHTLAGLPHAAGDGQQDDTAALQQLIDYGYRQRIALIFPPGVYLVSDTLRLEQAESSRDRHYYSHQLIGSTRGRKPVIRLVDNAPGFAGTKPTQTKPVIQFWADCAEGQECRLDEWETARVINFENGLRNLDIEVGEDNPGAIALSFSGSQYSFIEDVTIRLASGFAGLTHTPGLASVIGNLTIEGGRYGIYNANIGFTNGTTFTNLTLKNQRDCSIHALRSGKTITFVGFEISKATAPAICLTERGNIYVSLIDGRIDFAEAANEPAIDNPGGKLLTLTNVYARNAPLLYRQQEERVATPDFQPGVWYNVAWLYALDADSPTPALVDGAVVQGPNPLVGRIAPGEPPANLLTNHSWGAPDPSPDQLLEWAQHPQETGVCNAQAEATVRGDGSHDDLPGLAALVADPTCRTIFLGRGRFYLSGTLMLDADTQLYGLTPRLTELVAAPSPPAPQAADNAPTWQPTGPAYILATVDDPAATIKIANLRILFPTAPPERDWFVALAWRAGGRGSVIKNLQVRPIYSQTFGSNPKPDVLFTGHAAGRWFGAGSLGISENAEGVSAGKRRLLVENARGPLAFYNYNIEDGWAASADPAEGWQSEIVNSANVAIYGGKFEDRNGLRVKDSSNISLFALTNSDIRFEWDTSFTGERKALVVNLGSKFVGSAARTGEPPQLTGGDAQALTAIPLRHSLALYQWGEVDRSKFVFVEPQPNHQSNP